MGKQLAADVANGTVAMATLDRSVLRIITPMYEVGTFEHAAQWTNTTARFATVTSKEHSALARKIAAAGSVLLKNDNHFLPFAAESLPLPVASGGGCDPSNFIAGDLMGGDLVPLGVGFRNATSAADCCSKCAATSLCKFFSFAPPTSPLFSGAVVGHSPVGPPHNCWLKQTASSPSQHEHRISGSCNGSLPPPPSPSPAPAPPAPPAPPSPPTAPTVAVIGAQAKDPAVHGGGSGEVIPTYVVAPLDAITAKVGKSCVTYNDGTNPASAAAAAAAADLVVVVVGMSSAEGHDRTTLAYPTDQLAMVTAVAAAAGKKTVVVAINPGAILAPWVHTVAATLLMNVPGLEMGNALVDLLYGDVVPSGRLPITLPNKDNEVGFTEEQYPGTKSSGSDGHLVSNYSERLRVGYRWYDATATAPAFPFGYGLSYTAFGYSGLTVDNAALTVTFKLANVGKVFAGAEVPQLYLGFPAAAEEPPKQLKAFTKVQLAVGAVQTVVFTLTPRALSVWDEVGHKWALVEGTFGVFVGSSSRDIRLTSTLVLKKRPAAKQQKGKETEQQHAREKNAAA